jgi:hypothetical protein
MRPKTIDRAKTTIKNKKRASKLKTKRIKTPIVAKDRPKSKLEITAYLVLDVVFSGGSISF